MLFKTHLAFGLLTALILRSFFSLGNNFDFIIFTVFVLLGALLPDFDNPNSKAGKSFGIVSVIFNKLFGHRGISHGIFFPLILTILISIFWSRTFGLAIFVGYLSHILIDGLTKQGVNLLHPISTLHIRGFVETGSFVETIIFLALLVGIGFKLFMI